MQRKKSETWRITPQGLQEWKRPAKKVLPCASVLCRHENLGFTQYKLQAPESAISLDSWSKIVETLSTWIATLDYSGLELKIENVLNGDILPLVSAFCGRYELACLTLPSSHFSKLPLNAKVDTLATDDFDCSETELKKCKFMPLHLALDCASSYAANRAIALFRPFYARGLSNLQLPLVSLMEDKTSISFEWLQTLQELELTSLTVHGYNVQHSRPWTVHKLIVRDSVSARHLTECSWPNGLHTLHVALWLINRRGILFPPTLTRLQLELRTESSNYDDCVFLQHLSQYNSVSQFIILPHLSPYADIEYAKTFLALENAFLTGVSARAPALPPITWIEFNNRERKETHFKMLNAPDLVGFKAYFYCDPNVLPKSRRRIAWAICCFSLAAYRANQKSRFGGDACLPCIKSVFQLLGSPDLGAAACELSQLLPFAAKIPSSRFGLKIIS